MTERRCENCEFWVAFGRYSNLAGKGSCRRFPPGEIGFPVISADKWCGEFKPAVRTDTEDGGA